MIRPARPSDLDAVVRLAVAAGMFSEEESPFVAAMMTEYFDHAADEGHRCLVDADADADVDTEDEADVRAVAYYQPKAAADRVWDLTMIAVRPALQGGGLGRALLGHVEDALRAEGQRLLLVDTSGTAQYDRTREFYRRCGYDEEARIRDYWTEGDDLVVFRKALAEARVS